MNLPHAHSAIVEQQKITNYLLNPAHPDNGGKAQFFMTMGFHREQWETFSTALRNMAVNTQVTKCIESVHGIKYVLEGEIETPCGKTPRVRSVWIVDRGSDYPRLITCYPSE